MINIRLGIILALMALCLGGASAGEIAKASVAKNGSVRPKPTFSQYLTIDANRHFVNENGPFLGYGTNYNQKYGGTNHYDPYDYNMAQMDTELAALASRGFTHVALRVFWGLYVNSATRATSLAQWEAALNLLEKHGLYAVIWFDPMNSWPTAIPGDQRYEVMVRNTNWNLFLDHIRDFAGRYKNRKCIVGFRIENESCHINDDTLTAQVPELVQRFQTFLTDKYGTIAALNAKWDSSYASFQAIPLPAKDPQTGLYKDPLMMEYNYFREWFIAMRCQEFGAETKKVSPNHLTLISGIGSIGGFSALFEHHNLDRFTNFSILANGQYPNDYRDGAFIASYQSVLHYGRTTRPFLSFGMPAMVTEVSIWDTPSGVRVSNQQLVDWILTNWFDCVGDGGIGMDIWDNLLVQYEDYNNTSTTSDPNTTQMVNIGQFTSAMAGVDVKFTAPVPEVLLLRNKATNYSLSSPWRDLGNYQAVCDWMYQLHVPFDVFSEANIDATMLEKYKAIVICSQTQLYDDSVWAMFRSWIEAKPGRVLVNGLYWPQDTHFKPRNPSTNMNYLMGLNKAAYNFTTNWIGVDYKRLDFIFKEKFGSLNSGARVPFNMVASTWNIPKSAMATSAKVLAEISEPAGMPLLIQNTLPNTSRVYTFGIPTGFVWWAIDGTLGPVAHDGMVPIYRQMLADAGVAPAFDAPTNLGVYVAPDKSALLFKERYSTPTDAIFTGDLGGAVYDVKACDVTTTGQVTLHDTIRAHGWQVVRRLPIKLAPVSTASSIEVTTQTTKRVEFKLDGAAACAVTLSALAPSYTHMITIDGGDNRIIKSDATGTIVFDVPAGNHTVIVKDFLTTGSKHWGVFE